MKLLEFIGDKSIEIYFNEKIEECKDMEELPRELTNCSCCDRHREKFPNLGEYIRDKPTNFKFKFGDLCKCPCRHIARHICREWNNIYEVDEIESEEVSEEDSEDSLEDFIVPDKGFKKKERKELDKALNMFRGKKHLRR